MSDKTSLGDRMKFYEKTMVPTRFMPMAPVCARIDGKSFSTFTKSLARPFDANLTELMVLTTHYLVSETNACIGYTQSDEISLVWFTDNSKSQIFMDGKRDKMVSLLAAMTSAFFNRHLHNYLPGEAEQLDAVVPQVRARIPIFDARVWQVPTQREAANYLLWRERDATKNSVATAAQEQFSHKALHCKTGSDMQDMLHAKGINWNDYPACFKRGTYVQRSTVKRAFSAEEIDRLPEKHAARQNPNLMIARSIVRTLVMPQCGSIMNFADVIFSGADPLTNEQQ
jgi:tRNA(His) guanylyltransferase